MKKIALISAIVVMSAAQTAMAADGVINFSGNITSTACTVNTSSATQTVTLGTISSTAFNGSGSTAAPTRFTIELTTCPVAVSQAKVRFDGTTSSGNPSIVGLNSGQTATNVGVAIYEKDSATLIPVGTASAGVALSSTGVNTMAYIAKYMATDTTVGAGTANATATFTITYS
ncbi:fimbrial protein [Serratia fonticola]|nr:fimbrial protein [Serratia fonticola]